MNSERRKLYSLDERVFLIKLYARHYGNHQEIIDEFVLKFPDAPIPSHTTLWRMMKRFEDTGSVMDRPRCGRTRSVMTEENMETVALTFVEDNNQSARKLSNELGIARTSLRRIMKVLGLKVYRPTLHQALSVEDYSSRRQFCEMFIIRCESDSGFERSILWSDEATFKTNGILNRHNCVYYSTVNPNVVLTEELNAPGVCVWAGICSYGIIGPYFHEGNVNAEKYLEMLEEVVIELENNVRFQNKRIIWQQDGAPCHFALSVRKFLNEHFEEWIGRAGKFVWPPRSPDLTPCDFSMWGLLKDRVYQTKIKSLSHLKQRIEEEFEILSLDRNYCINVTKTVKKRALACLQANGEHFEQTL